MIYLAYDHVIGDYQICGDLDFIKRSPWHRTFLRDLRDMCPADFTLERTSTLLQRRLKFAYAISWRLVFDYGTPNIKDVHRDVMRSRLAWLKRPEHEELLNAFRDGRALLLFLDWYEGEIDVDHDYKFQVAAEFLGIPVRSIVFVHGNARAEERSAAKDSPVYICENIFERNMIKFPEVQRANPAHKPFRFLSYARHWNDYRQYLTAEFFLRGLDKFGIFSCADFTFTYRTKEEAWETDLTNWAASPAEHQQLMKFRDAFFAKLPIIADFDLSINLVYPQHVNVSHFESTDLSIVNETYCDSRTVFITEKTYKAINMRHPFLIMGNPGSLQHLRELGYKTFHPHLDESYDSEHHLPTRKNALLQTLTDFCKLPVDVRLRKREKLDKIAEYNFHHLRRYGERHTFGKNLIRFLRAVVNEETHNAV